MNIDKIGQNGVDSYVQKTQSSNGKLESQAAKETSKTNQDEVSISAEAKQLQSALRAVQSAPDVREERVEAIKKQIKDGTYNVPPEAVADKLLSGLKDG